MVRTAQFGAVALDCGAFAVDMCDIACRCRALAFDYAPEAVAGLSDELVGTLQGDHEEGSDLLIPPEFFAGTMKSE